MNNQEKPLKNERITVRLDESDVRKMTVLQIELGGVTKSELVRIIMDKIYVRIGR
jgi:hypothetical protein